MSKLSHVDESGAANMVDVGDKPVTQREARAAAPSGWRRKPWT